MPSLQTANSIVAAACAQAQVPSYLEVGRSYLQLELQKLWQIHDLEVNLQEVDFALRDFNPIPNYKTVIPSPFGPYALPKDYVRSYTFSYELFGGSRLVLRLDKMSTYDSLPKSSGISGLPTMYFTDLSEPTDDRAGVFYLFPSFSNSASTMKLRYLRKRDDITNFDAPVWFDNDKYLIFATAANLHSLAGDMVASAKAMADAMELLEGYIVMKADDKQPVPITLKLNANFFRATGKTKGSVLPPDHAYPYPF